MSSLNSSSSFLNVFDKTITRGRINKCFCFLKLKTYFRTTFALAAMMFSLTFCTSYGSENLLSSTQLWLGNAFISPLLLENDNSISVSKKSVNILMQIC